MNSLNHTAITIALFPCVLRCLAFWPPQIFLMLPDLTGVLEGSQPSLLSHLSFPSWSYIFVPFHWINVGEQLWASKKVYGPHWPTRPAVSTMSQGNVKLGMALTSQTVWERSKDWIAGASDHHLAIWKRLVEFRRSTCNRNWVFSSLGSVTDHVHSVDINVK